MAMGNNQLSCKRKKLMQYISLKNNEKDKLLFMENRITGLVDDLAFQFGPGQPLCQGAIFRKVGLP